MSSLFDLTGKVAIVTGSTKGIGLAIATRMAEHGATVVVSSRKPDACEVVAQGIRDAGGKAIVVPCHVAFLARRSCKTWSIKPIRAMWRASTSLCQQRRGQSLPRSARPGAVG